jgi:hypothetical protein
MSAQLYSIGPSSIADPGITGGPGFSMSRREWIAIQTYSTDALALPTTLETFRNSLGPGHRRTYRTSRSWSRLTTRSTPT